MEEHEHGHACNHSHADKYHKCIERFDPALSADVVAEKMNNLLEKSYQKNFNSETLKQVYGLIDLTTLTTLDTKETVWQMVEKVNAFEGLSPDMSNVAAICTYPVFTATVKQALTVIEIGRASCRERV